MPHEMTLSRGKEPVVLRQFGVMKGDPSGFEGWAEAEIECLFASIHKELDGIIDISSMLPSTIPVYVKPKHMQPTHAAPNAVQPAELIVTRDRYGIERKFMTQKSNATSMGIVLGFERQDVGNMNSDDREGIRHELVHIATCNAIEIYEALTEGIVEYLSQDQREQSAQKIDWRKFPWDSHRFQGTTGLRTGNYTFLDLAGTKEELAGLYALTRIIAMCAFQRQTHDQIWEICKSLHHLALKRGSYPTYDDFCEVTHQVLPGMEAQELLKQLLFREMTPGDHGYLLPLTESHRSILAQSLRVQTNPDYGIVDQETGVPSYRPYTLTHIPSTIEYRAQTFSGDGGSLTVAHQKPQTVSPETIASILQDQNVPVQGNQISSLVCSMRGLCARVL
jgi:hypothetical protein